MKNPIFSVVIPAYNHEKYIGDAIRSVLNQTFQDFEIVVVNDGSTDNTEKVILSFKDDRIRYYSQENHDAAYTINRGIKESKGGYIAILNSDDVFAEKKLEESYTELKNGFDFVFGKIKVIDEFGHDVDRNDPKVRWIEEKLNNTRDDISLQRLLLNINYFITTSNFVFKKELAEKVGYFHERLHYSHDFDFLLKLYSLNVRMRFIPSYCCSYRIHNDNTITKGKVESVIEACYSIEKFLRSVTNGREMIPVDLFKSPIYIATLFFMLGLSDSELEDLISMKTSRNKEILKEVIMFYVDYYRGVENNNADLQIIKSSRFWRVWSKYSEFNEAIRTGKIWFCLRRFLKKRLKKNKMYVNKFVSLFDALLYLIFKLLGKLRYQQLKSDQPLVSVIIPCYNYGRFIEEAIDSVLASTYQNVEIIVVDDGPTDPYTIGLLKHLDKVKTRVIFQENQGLARARNNGIRQSKGEFILPLDADDRIDPTYIEKASYVLQQNPFRAFAYGHVQLFGEDDSVWYTGEYDLEHLKKENIIPSCSLFRKEAWEKVGGYENDRDQYDDWTFWLKLGASGFHGKLIPEVLFFHRKHEGLENMTERMKLRHEEYYQKIKNLLPSLYRLRLFNKIWNELNRRILKKKELHWRNEFLYLQNQSSNKKKLLVFLPWTIRGGAEKVTLDVIKNLNDWEVFIVTTLTNKYDVAVDLEFKSITKNVYHLPGFLSPEEYWPFVEGLILSQGIGTVLINHCAWAYEHAEKMTVIGEGVDIFDLLHNTMDGGYKEWSKKYFQWIKKTIVISDELRRDLVEKGGFPQDRVKCILNGVDTEGTFDPENFNAKDVISEFHFPENKKGIVFIGRLSPEKDPLKFVSVARRINQVFPDEYFFILVGGGDLMDTVVEEARKYFDEKDFIFLGNYSYPERILVLSHLLINTSVIEGMPLTIMESLSMNVPVIAPAIGAVGEIVIDGKNGWLLSEKPSIEEYIEAIRKTRNETVYNTLRTNARQSVIEKYSAKRMASEYEDVFLNI